LQAGLERADKELNLPPDVATEVRALQQRVLDARLLARTPLGLEAVANLVDLRPSRAERQT